MKFAGIFLIINKRQYLHGACRLLRFCGEKTIIVPLVRAERASPFPTVYHGENANLNSRTRQRASSFRNLSSNGVRYKFREREKVKITFPAKPEANLIFDRDFVEVERSDHGKDESTSSKSAACVYGRRLRQCL